MFEQDETCLLLLQWKVTSLIRPLLYKRAKLDLRLTNTFVFFYLPQTRTLHLHNPECGSIRDIFPIETVKGHVLVTCGQDGSIMLHQVHTLGILKNVLRMGAKKNSGFFGGAGRAKILKRAKRAPKHILWMPKIFI